MAAPDLGTRSSLLVALLFFFFFFVVGGVAVCWYVGLFALAREKLRCCGCCGERAVGGDRCCRSIGCRVFRAVGCSGRVQQLGVKKLEASVVYACCSCGILVLTTGLYFGWRPSLHFATTPRSVPTATKAPSPATLTRLFFLPCCYAAAVLCRETHTRGATRPSYGRARRVAPFPTF